MIETKKYIRKPLYVDAVQVTEENFDEIVTWCQGEAPNDDGPQAKKYIKVRVHNPKNIRQSQAFVGDWLLYTERGYKVYTNKAFHASFNPVIEVQDGEGETETTTLVEVVDATPQSIAQAVEENTKAREAQEEIEKALVSSSTELTVSTNGTTPSGPDVAMPVTDPSFDKEKRVLSIREQKVLGADEVRELILSGEAVLEQDLGV